MITYMHTYAGACMCMYYMRNSPRLTRSHVRARCTQGVHVQDALMHTQQYVAHLGINSTSICISAAPQPVSVLFFGLGAANSGVAYCKALPNTEHVPTEANRCLAKGYFGTCIYIYIYIYI